MIQVEERKSTAFATQCAVNNLGYETEVINIDSVQKEVSAARKKYFTTQIFNIPELKSYVHVFGGMVKKFLSPQYKLYISDREKMFKHFRIKHFNFSPICNSWIGLRDYCIENYDNVLVGSDQLWRPANIAGNFYTLNFVPLKVNKIAYATSFGLKEARRNQEDVIKKYLKRINHLSTREKTGAEIIKKSVNRNVPVVVDPTLLLNTSEWSKFVDDEPIISGKYILVYYLGDNPEHRKFVKKLSKVTGYKIVGILHVAGFIKGDDELVDLKPENIGPFEFLNLIKNAAFVCTDSFHGCVFTIQFNRELFAFRRFSDNDKMSTNDRITTLLDSLNMENRLLYGTENIKECLECKTDYVEVQKILESKRKEGFEYLTNAFKKKNTDIE